ALLDQRRRRGAEEGRFRGWLRAPQELAVRGVEGGDDTADAEGVETAVMEQRRGFGTGAMLRGRLAGRVGRGIAGMPTLLAGRGVEPGFVGVKAQFAT